MLIKKDHLHLAGKKIIKRSFQPQYSIGMIAAAVSFSFFGSACANEDLLPSSSMSQGHAFTALLLALVSFLFIFSQFRYRLNLKLLKNKSARLDLENAQFHQRNMHLERLIDTKDTIYLFFEAGYTLPFVIGRLDDIGVPRRAEDILDVELWLERTAATLFLDKMMLLKKDGQNFEFNCHSKEGRPLLIKGHAVNTVAIIEIQCMWEQNLKFEELVSLHAKAQDRLYLFQNLLEQLPLPVWIEDKEKQLEWANSAFVTKLNKGSLPELRTNYENIAVVNNKEIVSKFTTEKEVIAFLPLTKEENNSYGFDSEQASILFQIPTPVAIFSKDQRLDYWNLAFEQLWGIETKWLQKSPNINDILDRLYREEKLPQESDKPHFRSEFMSLFDRDNQQPHRWLLLDGRSIDIKAVARSCGGTALLFEDVSKGLALRNRIQQMLQLQKDTLNGLSDGVIVFNSAGKVTLYNKAFCDMWQMDDVSLDDAHAETIFAHTKILFDDHDIWRKIGLYVTGIGEARTGLRGEMERLDGKVLDYMLEPLGAASYVLSFIDNTHHVRHQQELANSNSQLAQANQFKSNFVNNISYELRTLLTSVVGYGEFLYNEGGLSLNQEEYANHIVAASSSVLAIIDDILDLASIDDGLVDLKFEAIDVRATINSALGGVQSRFNYSNLALQIIDDTKITSFEADESRVRQTLFKLLSTAADSSQSNTTVFLKCFTEKDFIAFTVENQPSNATEVIDTKGIISSDPSKFSPGNSLNISLAIIENLVEHHGGWIEFQSDPVGKRAITCYFPIKQKNDLAVSER